MLAHKLLSLLSVHSLARSAPRLIALDIGSRRGSGSSAFFRSSWPGEQAFRPHHETQVPAESARSGAVRCRHFSTPAVERWLAEKGRPASSAGRTLTELCRGSAQ